MTGREDDDLLLALQELRTESPDPERSRAILTGAADVMRRRRHAAERRVALLRAVYAGALEPIAATGLSFAFLASVLIQALAVLHQAHSGFLWR